MVRITIIGINTTFEKNINNSINLYKQFNENKNENLQIRYCYRHK